MRVKKKAWAVIRNGKIATMSGLKRGIYLIVTGKNFFDDNEIRGIVKPCEITFDIKKQPRG